MYDPPEEEVNRCRDSQAGDTAIRQRPIELLHGERAFLAWDAYPEDSAAPKALTPVVSYSVIGDAALQHIHEHSSTCPDRSEQAWYSPKARCQPRVAVGLAYFISDQQINTTKNCTIS